MALPRCCYLCVAAEDMGTRTLAAAIWHTLVPWCDVTTGVNLGWLPNFNTPQDMCEPDVDFWCFLSRFLVSVHLGFQSPGPRP